MELIARQQRPAKLVFGMSVRHMCAQAVKQPTFPTQSLAGEAARAQLNSYNAILTKSANIQE